jgi:hypothetical protein
MPIGPQPISTARPTRLNVYLVEEPARLRFEFRGLPYQTLLLSSDPTQDIRIGSFRHYGLQPSNSKRLTGIRLHQSMLPVQKMPILGWPGRARQPKLSLCGKGGHQ